MRSTLVIAIWSCGTGQQIPCCDSCPLTTKWISQSKLQKCKLHPKVDPSWPAYFLWAPSCATPSSNKHPQRLHLSPWCGHVTLVSGCFALTAINWHEYPMPFSWCEPFYNLMFSNLPGWGRCDTSTATAAVVGDSARPRAIPLNHLKHVWIYSVLSGKFVNAKFGLFIKSIDTFELKVKNEPF